MGISGPGTASACCSDWLRMTSMPPGIEGIGDGGISAANKISNANTTAWPATEKARGSLILFKARHRQPLQGQRENIAIGGALQRRRTARGIRKDVSRLCHPRKQLPQRSASH